MSQNSFTQRLREKDQPFFGFTKDGQLPPVALLLRHRNGNQQAFNYQYLTKSMDYNPSDGITLSFCDPNGTVEVTIEGRNLSALWDQLMRHKVTFIEPVGMIPDDTPEEELCVTDILVDER